MERDVNPYTPGAGVRPPELLGRDRELARWSSTLRRVARGYAPRPIAMYGLRGVGKTVLLSAMADEAEQSGWWTIQLEAASGKPMRQSIGESLYRPLASATRPSAGIRMLRALKTAMSFKMSYDLQGNAWNFGVDLSESRGGGADSGLLESDLEKLVQDCSEAAREEDNSGLAIIVDEAQDLDFDELVALCAVAHRAGQRKWPFVLAVGGLPSLPRVLAEAKSYAERLFEFFRIEQLSEQDTRAALVSPASLEGVGWEESALDFVTSETQGYPFFIQQFGSSAWDSSTGATIDRHAAEVGGVAARAELDRGFFQSRWERATKTEREYLRAMAEDQGDASSAGNLAERLGRSVQGLGPARANLMNKGLIYAPEHGKVAFTVPLIHDFIQRQPRG